MTVEKKSLKKNFIHNCIELIIWIALLRMCYWYIQTHPAEKISFFSGYKVLYQQTEIAFQNIFGNNWDYLKQKYELESYYQVLITLAEEKSCTNPNTIQDLLNTYKELQNEPKKTLEHTLSYYIQKQYEFNEEINQTCPNEDKMNENSNEYEEENNTENNKD